MNSAKEENEKSQTILSKTEEIKKMVKQFKSVIFDFFKENQQYGKNNKKAAETLSAGLAWSHGQELPNLLLGICKLFLTKSTVTIQKVSELSKSVTNDLDQYFESLKNKHQEIEEEGSTFFKNAQSSKNSFGTSKSKYEKQMGEADKIIQEYNKCKIDAKCYYNTHFMDKMALDIKKTIREVSNREKSLQHMIQEANHQQKNQQDGVNTSYKKLQDFYKSTLEKMIDISVKSEGALIAKFEEFLRLLSQKEVKAIQNEIVYDMDSQDRSIVERSATSPNSISFLYLQDELHQPVNSLKDQQYLMFIDIANQHVTSVKEIIDTRKQNYKAVRDFLKELNEAIETFIKGLRKISKNNLITSGSILSQKGWSSLENFFLWLDIYIEDLVNYSTFIASQLVSVEAFIQDQRKQRHSFLNMWENSYKQVTSLKDQGEPASQIKPCVSKASLVLWIGMGEYRKTEGQMLNKVRGVMESLINQNRVMYEEFIKKVQKTMNNMKLQSEELENEIVSAFSQDEAMYLIQFEKQIIQEFQFNQWYIVPEEWSDFNDESAIQGSLINESPAQSIINENQGETENQPSIVLTDQPENLNLSGLQINQNSAGGLSTSQNLSEDITSSSQQSASGHMTQENLSNSVKKSDKTKLKLKFKVSQQDSLISDYSCAFSHGILLQGRMYIYHEKVCFHSHFNNKNVFGGETILAIPFSDVVKIDKKKNLGVFDNSLNITTIKGDLFFTSYIERDNCFKILLETFNKTKNIGDRLNDSFDESGVKQGGEVTTPPNEERKSFENSNEEEKENRGGLEEKVAEKQNSDDMEINIGNNILSQGSQELPTNQKGSQTFTSEEVLSDKKSNRIEGQAETQVIQSDSTEQSKIVVSNKDQIEKTSAVINSSNSQNIPDSSEQVQQATSVRVEPITVKNYQEKWENNKNRYIQSSIFKDPKTFVELETQISNVSAREVFIMIFYNKKQTFSNFCQWLMFTHQQDKEITFGKFQPEPPSFYKSLESGNIDDIATFGSEYCLREFKFIHPVREKAPFTPKVVTVDTKEKVYFISDTEVAVERQLTMSKIPFCDCFTQRAQFTIKEDPVTQQTSVKYGFYVNFIKSTMFKGKIESSATSENTDVWKTQLSVYIVKEMEAYAAARDQQKQLLISQQQKNEEAAANAASLQSVASPVVQQPLKPVYSSEIQYQEIQVQETVQMVEKEYPQAWEIRRKNAKKSSGYGETNKSNGMDFVTVFSGLSARELFILLFLTRKGNSNSFFEWFMTNEQLDQEIVFGAFQPKVPEYFQSVNSINTEQITRFSEFSVRQYSFVHPVREKSVFAPQECSVKCVEQVFWVAPTEVIIERQFFMSQIPFSDTFTQKVQYQIITTDPSQKSTSMHCSFYINHIQSCWVKGQIQKAAKAENEEDWQKKLEPLIHKEVDNYIKNKPAVDSSKGVTQMVQQKVVKQAAGVPEIQNSPPAIQQNSSSENSALLEEEQGVRRRKTIELPESSRKPVEEVKREDEGSLITQNASISTLASKETFENMQKQLENVNSLLNEMKKQNQILIGMLAILLLSNLLILIFK